jgi:hypothetical protein
MNDNLSHTKENTMTKRAIFNPLDGTSISSSGMQSTSSLINTEIGVCPKCSKPMGESRIANADTVYYCDSCRVSTPMLDKV